MTLIDDYAGNAYGGRTRHKRSAGGQRSMRCLDCGKLRYVLPRELRRANTPHCLKCGGALEEISVSKKRQGLAVAMPKPRSAVRRCPACGIRIENNEWLSRHLLSSAECIEYHVRERKLYLPSTVSPESEVGELREYLIGEGVEFTTLPTAIILGTVGVYRLGNVWIVQGISASGKQAEVYRGKTRTACQRFIYDEMGPVELAR